MKKIITISREFGAGGGSIGQLVAERLGYEFYDKAIILEAAKQSNLDVQKLALYDEKVPVDFGFAQSLFDFYNKPLNERLFDAQKKVIQKMAEKGNCVIVGRNANSILREYDHVLHVFVHAPSYYRLKRMKERFPDMPENQLSEQLQAVDHTRKKYCAYYTNTVFGMASYYDLSINTAKIGIDTAVEMICDLAKK